MYDLIILHINFNTASLEKVQELGSGLNVINDYLFQSSDTASMMSAQSTHSHKLGSSMKSRANLNIDQILQQMLSNPSNTNDNTSPQHDPMLNLPPPHETIMEGNENEDDDMDCETPKPKETAHIATSQMNQNNDQGQRIAQTPQMYAIQNPGYMNENFDIYGPSSSTSSSNSTSNHSIHSIHSVNDTRNQSSLTPNLQSLRPLPNNMIPNQTGTISPGMGSSTLSSIGGLHNRNAMLSPGITSVRSAPAYHARNRYNMGHHQQQQQHQYHQYHQFDHGYSNSNSSFDTGSNYNNNYAFSTFSDEYSIMSHSRYGEYKNLFLTVRERVVKAKVLAFGGKCIDYVPFQWATTFEESPVNNNDDLLGIGDEKESKDSSDQSVGVDSNRDNVNNVNVSKFCKKRVVMTMDDLRTIDDRFYKLLGNGILSTFMPQAIIGQHLIDTTPLIDSEELEHASNQTFDLRCKLLSIFENSMGRYYQNSIVLRRWFRPNKDFYIKYDSKFITQWIKNMHKSCIRLLNYDINQKNIELINDSNFKNGIVLNGNSNNSNNNNNSNVKSKNNDHKPYRVQRIQLNFPIKLLLLLNKNGSRMSTITRRNIFSISTISEWMTATYCGVLTAMGYISGDYVSPIARELASMDKFLFETLLAVEMLQHNDLNEDIYTLIDENGKSYQIDSLASRKYRFADVDHKLVAKRRAMRLITRVCCLLPIRPFIQYRTPNANSPISTTTATNTNTNTNTNRNESKSNDKDGNSNDGIKLRIWKDRLSQSMSAFNHVSTVYYKTLYHLIESVICWLFLAGNNRNDNYNNDDLFEVNVDNNPKLLYELMIEMRTRLPPEPCIGCGVLLEEFLNNFSTINWFQYGGNNNNNNNNNNGGYYQHSYHNSSSRRPPRFYNSKNPNYQQNIRHNNNSYNNNNNNNSNDGAMNEAKRRKVLIKYINSLKKKFSVFTNIISAIVCCLQFFEQVEYF